MGCYDLASSWRATCLGAVQENETDPSPVASSRPAPSREGGIGQRRHAVLAVANGGGLLALGLLCFVALASLLADDRDGIACGCGDLTYRRCEEGRALRIETGVVPAQKSRPHQR